MLTRLQREVLLQIEADIAGKGIAPSVAELAAVHTNGNNGSAHRVLVALEERGYIRRLPFRARAIDVIRKADGAVVSTVKTTMRCVPVPMMGRIS